ncbi:MAG: outer membrane protein assembly factor BamD [Planctomycetota bacterium]
MTRRAPRSAARLLAPCGLALGLAGGLGPVPAVYGQPEASEASPEATQSQQRYELGVDGWQALGPRRPDPASPLGRLAAVRALLAQSVEALEAGEEDRSQEIAQQAVDLGEAWLEDFPRTGLEAEARLLLGDAKAASGELYRALTDYEVVAAGFPGSEQFIDALWRQYEIGLRLAGGESLVPVLGFFKSPGPKLGEELLIRIQERAPGSVVGEDASFALADYYYQRREMGQAAVAYELFLANYPRSRRREWALLRLINSSLGRFRGPRFDATVLIEASERILQYEQEFPATADRVSGFRLRIREALAERDLLNGQWFETRGKGISAAVLYRAVVLDYPETAAARRALARLGDLDVDLGRLDPPTSSSLASLPVDTPFSEPTEPEPGVVPPAERPSREDLSPPVQRELDRLP